MKVAKFSIRKLKDLSKFDELNIDNIEKHWNKDKYQSFDEFKQKNGFDNYNALKYIYEYNKKENLINLELKKTKSLVEDDLEKITLTFKDETEADKYFEYLKANFQPKSLMYELKKDDNKIEFYYTRMTIDEKNSKVYRTKQTRITKDLSKFNEDKLTSFNINSLEIMQNLHKKDKELLVNMGFDVASFNDTLNSNDKDVKELKDKYLYLLNKTNSEVKKDNLNKRGSNNVSNNIKKDIQKDEIKDKVEKDVKSSKKIGSFETFIEVQKRIFEKKIEELVKNENAILKSYDGFIKDGYSFDEAISKLEKSYKNEYLKDFIINKLEDRNLENIKLKEEIKEKDESIEVLKEKLEDVVEKAENEINRISDKLNEVVEIGEVLEKENKQLKVYKDELDKKVYSLNNENETLKNENEKLVNELNKVVENKEEIEKAFYKLTEVSKKLENENRELKAENEKLLNSNVELENIVKNVNNENKELKKRVEDIFNENKELLNKNIEVNNEKNKIINELDIVKKENEKLQNSTKILKDDFDNLMKSNVELENIVKNVNNENKELKEQLERISNKLNELEKVNNELENKLHQKDMEIVKLETKVEVYESLKEVKNEEKKENKEEMKEKDDVEVDEESLKEAKELLGFNDEEKKVKKQ